MLYQARQGVWPRQTLYELTAGPSAEPVTLAEAKLHARIDIDDDDALVTDLIAAARQWVEENTGRCLIHQTWRLTLDAWPAGQSDDWWSGVRVGPISQLDAAVARIERSPVVSVTSVTTLEESGSATTWDAANYYLAREPQGYGRLTRRQGVSWPSVVGRDAGAIQITFVAGYGADPSAVPYPLRHAIKMLVAHWYENRGPTGEAGQPVPQTLLSATAPFRILRTR